MIKVSVCIVTHNRSDFLRQSITSVLNQTFPPYEIIVIDDGSTDDTSVVIREFREERIRYYYYDRIARLPRLRNLALSYAGGEFVAFIDSDDLWHPDKLNNHVEKMSKTKAAISFSDCQLFDNNGPVGELVCLHMNKQNVDIFREMVYRRQSLAYGTNLFFRRIIDGKAALFDEIQRYTGDHDFVVMLSAQHKAVYIDQVLNFIRIHSGNTSNDSIWDILCPLEYNRTLAKLLDLKKITPATFRGIKANNYIKVGVAYYSRGRARASMRYLFAGILLSPRPIYFKILAKALLLRAGFKIYQGQQTGT